MASEDFYFWDSGDLIFRAKVQPRASKDEWLAQPDTGIRIRITAPPVEGQANRHLLRFLSKLFGVKRSAIEVLSGETSRYKRFRVSRPSQLPEIFSK